MPVLPIFRQSSHERNSRQRHDPKTETEALKIKTKAELALEKALKERNLKPGTKPKKKPLRPKK